MPKLTLIAFQGVCCFWLWLLLVISGRTGQGQRKICMFQSTTVFLAPLRVRGEISKALWDRWAFKCPPEKTDIELHRRQHFAFFLSFFFLSFFLSFFLLFFFFFFFLSSFFSFFFFFLSFLFSVFLSVFLSFFSSSLSFCLSFCFLSVFLSSFSSFFLSVSLSFFLSLLSFFSFFLSVSFCLSFCLLSFYKIKRLYLYFFYLYLLAHLSHITMSHPPFPPLSHLSSLTSSVFRSWSLPSSSCVPHCSCQVGQRTHCQTLLSPSLGWVLLSMAAPTAGRWGNSGMPWLEEGWRDGEREEEV